jgi:hypothetical protein
VLVATPMVAPFDKRPVSIAVTLGTGVAGIGDLVGLVEIVVFGTAVEVGAGVTGCSSSSDFLDFKRRLTNSSAMNIITITSRRCHLVTMDLLLLIEIVASLIHVLC